MKSHLLKLGSNAVPVLFAALLVVAASSANGAVTLLGNPYTPTGADFSIHAIQGLDLSTGNGSGGSPQVNLGVEFDDGLGVSYTDQNNHLRNFGLGLYSAQNQTLTTGLRIQYTSLINPSSLTVRLEDFDLSATDTFFKPNKVEPGMLILGANNTILGNALPTDIWSALSVVHRPNGQFQDVWELNFAQVLANLHLQQNTPINGFILYADRTAGEQANSDPYFLVSVGNGIPVIPEPATYFAGIMAFVIAFTFHFQQARKKKAIATVKR
jgi:hypothetical protein